jgi:hypothetical protein
MSWWLRCEEDGEFGRARASIYAGVAPGRERGRIGEGNPARSRSGSAGPTRHAPPSWWGPRRDPAGISLPPLHARMDPLCFLFMARLAHGTDTFFLGELPVLEIFSCVRIILPQISHLPPPIACFNLQIPSISASQVCTPLN